MAAERGGGPIEAIARGLQGERGRHLAALLALGLAVRLLPAYLVYGSFDTGSWIIVARDFGLHINPYSTGKLNWPPLWPMLLFYVSRVEDVYGLPEHFAVKLIPCVVDAGIAPVLYAWFARGLDRPDRAFQRSLWYALNPIAIATCALQGQFESLPCMFSLLAVIAALRTPPCRLATGSAVWLGLAGFAKTWPLFLLPAYLRRMRSVTQQALYAAIAVAPTLLSVGALLAIDRDDTIKHVLSYRGATGDWGLTAFNWALPAGVARIWTHATLYLLYAAWIAVYVATWRRGTVAQVACLGLLTFYVFTSGAGVQYHVWVMALGLLADFRRARTYTIVGSLCMGTWYVFFPFNGEYFDFVRHVHTDLFWQTYLSQHATVMQSWIMLPFWLYCIWWWQALLREALTTPPLGDGLAVAISTSGEAGRVPGAEPTEAAAG